MKSREYISELYRNEAPALYQFVRKYVATKEMAEDIVQETFCTALAKAKEVKGHPEPVGWLYKTAKYNILYEKRKQRKYTISFEELESFIIDENSQLGYESVENDFVKSSLTEEEYGIIDRYYNQGYKSSEVAEQMGVNESTLRVKLMRIRKKLIKFAIKASLFML